MGGDPAASEPDPVRRVAGARGGHRGRFWGDILSNCSYSRPGSGGRDGGGVQFHNGVPIIVARICLVFCVPLHRRTNDSVLSCLWCIPKFVDRRNGR